ncbi:MAG: NADH-quinone oxidoreductase subunit C [Ignavibacteriales bacterium]
MDRTDRTDEFLSDMNNTINAVIRKKKRLYFTVRNEDLHSVVRYLIDKMGCRLSTATAMETYSSIEVLYQFSHDPSGYFYCPRIVITDKEQPKMNSISPLLKGAEWIEREMYELWGIKFEGHPGLEPLLTGNHPQGLKVPLRFRRTQ